MILLINWQVVATISAPILALFIGYWLNRVFESRPNLISYYGHVAAFSVRLPNEEDFRINTHAVILSNTGRKSAENVRVRHLVLPDFTIWPHIQHSVQELPGGGREIVIPVIVPKETITISYLYFPPTTYDQINAEIVFDQGFARQIPVLLQRIYPNWFIRSLQALILIGLISVIYLFFIFILWIKHFF